MLVVSYNQIFHSPRWIVFYLKGCLIQERSEQLNLCSCDALQMHLTLNHKTGFTAPVLLLNNWTSCYNLCAFVSLLIVVFAACYSVKLSWQSNNIKCDNKCETNSNYKES